MSENRFEAARAYIDNLERVFKDMMSEEHKAHMTNIRTLLDQAINAPDLPTVKQNGGKKIVRYELKEDSSDDVQTLYGLYEHYEDCCRFVCEFDYFDIEIGKTLRDTLNTKLNAPDLESLKREVWDGMKRDCAVSVRHYEGMCAAIDHLAPRIVREGFVVVPEELLQVSTELINKAFKIDEFGTLHIPMADLEMVSLFLKHKAMIAASKGD